MADGITIDIIGASNIFKEIEETPELVNGMVKTLYQTAMDNTFNGSQADVPVDRGDLKASGTTKVDDNGETFCFEVTYGDGQSNKTYNYPSSDSAYGEGGFDATGYAGLVEMGHLSRAGNPVPPQPYLAPNFDAQVEELMSALLDLFS